MGNQANARRRTSGKRKAKQPASASSAHEHENKNSSGSASATLSPPPTRPTPKPYHCGIPAYDRVHPAGHSLALDTIDEDDTTAAAALMSLSNAAGVFQQATPVRSHTTAAATSSVHRSRKAQIHSTPVPQPTIHYRAPSSPTLNTTSILNSDDDALFPDTIQNHSNAYPDNDDRYLNDQRTAYSQTKRKPTEAMDIGSESEDDNVICSDDSEDPWTAHVKSVRQFKIPFEVPYRSSKRNLSTITSHTNFDTFMNKLAAAMDTRVSLLRNISYLPSYKPKAKAHEGPNDILLECEQDWINLIRSVEGYLDSRTARQQKQSWSITILDKTPVDKAPVKDSSKLTKNSSSAAAAGSEQVASMSDAALLVSLRKETRCSTCQAPCYVLSSSDHYQYTDGDLNMWVNLASKHKAVIDKNNPPVEILKNLGENRISTLCTPSMGRYTERQQAVINLLRLIELQIAITEFCEAGYPEEFVRDEILPLLFPYFFGVQSSELTGDSTSSSDSDMISGGGSSTSTSSSSDSSTSTSSDSDIHTKIVQRHHLHRIHWRMKAQRLQKSYLSSSDSTGSSSGSVSEGELADTEMDSDDSDADDWDMAGKQADQRYLRPRNRYRRPPGHLRHILDVWKTDQPDQFRENLRIMPQTFDDLVADIEDDLVFMNQLILSDQDMDGIEPIAGPGTSKLPKKHPSTFIGLKIELDLI
ncbi:hypothetical protein C8R42DRAFT_763141 [Lentinula raphanica]|nr:hypothetical protein C8R42DRAFT_763141 [Lentinula raphanica]